MTIAEGFFSLAWLGFSLSLVAQTTTGRPSELPAPTGRFAIGRVTVSWPDPSRIEPLAATFKHRELMVDIWYPAEIAAGADAEYVDIAAYERALTADGVRKQFGAAYDIIKARKVQTHAKAGVPFARGAGRAPLLIFSPGGGMIREAYAVQCEELASHGYIVAAISHPYDAFVTIFPDGSHISYDGKRWPNVPSLEGESNLNKLEWHADDIRFVLDELSRSTALPVSGHADISRVGAFGHSFGGISAAHACQKDPRIKACLNQDGAVAMRPYYLDARGWGMDQPFMLIERAPRNERPSDAELAEMKVTRQELDAILARLHTYKDRVLKSSSKGSYRIVLQSGSTTHMDFSDLPLLGARERGEADLRTRFLEAAASYTRAFFDRNLRGIRSPLLKGKPANPLVEAVQRFAPGRRP